MLAYPVGAKRIKQALHRYAKCQSTTPGTPFRGERPLWREMAVLEPLLANGLAEKFAELRCKLRTDPAFLVLEVDESV